jgi:hypothetical protein
MGITTGKNDRTFIDTHVHPDILVPDLVPHKQII